MSLDLYFECPCCGKEVASFNITHNLSRMAQEAGIYLLLWRPAEAGVETAKQLIPLLEEGLKKLQDTPLGYFRQFDAPNGWGTYEQFVPWVTEVLEAARKYPETRLRSSI